MQSVAYVLSHFVGPFFAGAFMAAFVATSDPAFALAFLVLAGAFGLVIIPGKALSMVRRFDRLRA